MVQTGKETDYRALLGSVGGLRRGYTTGSCAQAAVKAALSTLETGKRVKKITIALPRGKKTYSGQKMTVPVEFCYREEEWYCAGVRKDSGDDNDITGNIIIGARVRKIDKPEAVVAGGEGVGRVTRPGLPVPVGESAINPVPKRMILGELEETLKQLKKTGYTGGLETVIFVPEGEEIAKKTWNPRIGIEGGISIIGTSGVVEPKSTKAFQASIGVVLKTAARRGFRKIILTPGYVGERYLFEFLGIPEERVATVGDHVGWAFARCLHFRFEEILLVGHIGKIAKVAAGIFDTHWSVGDARLETVAAWAAFEGADRKTVAEILGLRLAEESVSLLRRKGLQSTFTRIAERCNERLKTAALKNSNVQLDIGCVVLDLQSRVLGAFPDTFERSSGWDRFLS